MDESFLDEGSTANFDRATLEIKTENQDFRNSTDSNESKQDVSRTSNAIPKVSTNVVSIPYARIDIHSFFSDRNEVIERALADCQRDLISSTEEDEMVGSWLLTEISLWDTEKERFVLLTKTALYTVKYDLISLKILEYNRIPLIEVDTLVAGDLVYPPTSLLPSRNMFGVRIMWNRGQPLSLDRKWNPFAKKIPWVTFTSHPLFWHKGIESDKTMYDVNALHSALSDLLPSQCAKLENPIIIENYVGIGSLVHNRTGLGFFKIRGKVSF